MESDHFVDYFGCGRLATQYDPLLFASNRNYPAINAKLVCQLVYGVASIVMLNEMSEVRIVESFCPITFLDDVLATFVDHSDQGAGKRLLHC